MEIWSDIKGCEGFYQISNYGDVITLKTGKPKKMTPYKNKQGYLQVCFRFGGKKAQPFIHRLVAEAFLPKQDGKDFVNHKIEGDKGKTINIVEFNNDGSIDEERTTIEWCDSKYNNNYGTRNERVSKKMTNGKLSKIVLQYSLDGDLIREWQSTMECERNGFNHRSVERCCCGKQKTAYGFIWEYK